MKHDGAVICFEFRWIPVGIKHVRICSAAKRDAHAAAREDVDYSRLIPPRFDYGIRGISIVRNTRLHEIRDAVAVENARQAADMIFIGMCFHNHVERTIEKRHFARKRAEHDSAGAAIDEHLDSRRTLKEYGISLADIEHRHSQLFRVRREHKEENSCVSYDKGGEYTPQGER